MSMEVRLNTHGPGKLQTLAMISDEAGFNVVSTLIFGEKDAVLVDSTNMTFDEVVDAILAIVEEKRHG